MVKRPQLSLDSLVATKPGKNRPELVNRASSTRRGQTLRLAVDDWKRLKNLAVDEETTSHALLIEALNMLFQNRGLPPLV